MFRNFSDMPENISSINKLLFCNIQHVTKISVICLLKFIILLSASNYSLDWTQLKKFLRATSSGIVLDMDVEDHWYIVVPADTKPSAEESPISGTWRGLGTGGGTGDVEEINTCEETDSQSESLVRTVPKRHSFRQLFSSIIFLQIIT
ncbi:unnamed protein product [Nezara viridula]|uniref:Uncharacterized protein n=1 Tax=Nezara viridula TaxID=85310 RepID=A0A9P0H4F4_NEZVI|nr:unnamed protein product [Nezara viridula]